MKAPPIVLAALAALAAGPALSQDAGARTFAVEGVCERLVIAGADLTTQCSPALVQILERGIVDLFVSTAPDDASDAGGRMAIFRGRARDGGSPWSNHDVEFILLGSQSDDMLQTVEASGACTYQNPAEGVAAFACEATDEAGRVYSLSYRTDGLPPVAF